MLTLIKKSGLRIPKKCPEISNIKEFLTRRQERYESFNRKGDDFNRFYEEEKHSLVVPRFFPIELFLKNIPYRCIDKRDPGADIDIRHNIILRQGQEEIVDFILQNRQGTIKVPPGAGKTIIALYIIGELKKRTIILVHNNTLVNQWLDRIEEFTNISRENVLVLSNKKLSSLLEYEKYPIVISTVQTILSIKIRASAKEKRYFKRAKFGILVVDEAHTTTGAPKFSQASLLINAQTVIGLSATPYRFDQNHDIIEMHLGKIFAKSSIETMPVKVFVVLFDFEIFQGKRKKFIHWHGKFLKSRYLNFLERSEPLNKILDKILEKVTLEDRDILFIAERKKFLEKIKERHPEKNITLFIGQNGAEHLTGKIVLATVQKARDGLDLAHKDCLILSSPISNIEQAVGRVRRYLPNKKKPILFDIVDIGCPFILQSLSWRERVYRSKNWEISYILIDDMGNFFFIPSGKIEEVMKRRIKNEDGNNC